MFSMPATFHKFLSDNNLIKKMYKSMENDDYSEVVLTAWDILKKTRQVPPLPMMSKSAEISIDFRNNGNTAYKMGDVRSAFVLYNKALLFAPKNSKEMALAFSNRSMLLQSQTAYSASLADIEISLTMECKDILKKLRRRKKEVMQLAQCELIANAGLSLTAQYIDTNIQQNAEIACASSQVKINMSDNPKVVAATEVNPGSVLANERAFVSYTASENSFISCHFCQKMSLNLIPCDGCCHALFCDEQCRRKCITEYHEYECQIMDIINAILFGPSPNLMLKASLKIRSMSKSWKKLINDYNNKNTMQSRTIKDVFDYKNKFSILNVAFEKPFVYGIIYNASFACAAVIHYLKEFTSFFPINTDEIDPAIRVFSRIMIFLSIQQTPIQLIQASTALKRDKTNYFTKPNYGFYSFTGKIKTSCSPNVMAVNNNHQLILIALRTINYEEELTISTVWVEKRDTRHARNFNDYWISNTICNCNSCDETKCSFRDNKDKLSKEQLRYFTNINFGQLDYHMRSLDTCIVYPVILRALDFLSHVQYSSQYMEIMKYFKICILYFEATKSKNYILY